MPPVRPGQPHNSWGLGLAGQSFTWAIILLSNIDIWLKFIHWLLQGLKKIQFLPLIYTILSFWLILSTYPFPKKNTVRTKSKRNILMWFLAKKIDNYLVQNVHLKRKLQPFWSPNFIPAATGVFILVPVVPAKSPLHFILI